MSKEEISTNVVYRGRRFYTSSDTVIDYDDHEQAQEQEQQNDFEYGIPKKEIKSLVDQEDEMTGREFGFPNDETKNVIFEVDESVNQKYKKKKKRYEQIPFDKKERVMTQYIILNIVYIVMGILCLMVTLVLHFLESNMAEFLILNHRQSSFPPSLMYITSVVSILTGVLALHAFIRNNTGFFVIYDKFLWFIVSMNLASIMVSFGSWKLFNVSAYERIFEAEALFVRTKDHTYLDNFEGKFMGFWDKLQGTLKCCGMHNRKDFLIVSETMVDSCCRMNKMDVCLSTLNNWRIKKNMTYFEEISDLIYEKPCGLILHQEVNNLQRDWVLFPSMFALFYFIMMFSGNYLNRGILTLFRSIHGFELVTNYQEKYFKTWMKIIKLNTLNNINISNQQRNSTSKQPRRSNKLIPDSEFKKGSVSKIMNPSGENLQEVIQLKSIVKSNHQLPTSSKYL